MDRLSPNSSKKSPSPRTIYSDRFIPSRLSSNFDLFDVKSSKSPGKPDSPYNSLLRSVLFGSEHAQAPATPDKSSGFSGRVVDRSPDPNSDSGSSGNVNRNIFRYKSEVRRNLNSVFDFEDDLMPGVVKRKAPRKIHKSPYKVLDAPALQDDFYLNLVDWSANNVLAVGLENCVYLWNACSSNVTKLCDLGVDDSVCSVGWAQQGTHLAIGTNLGQVQIWDVSRCRRIRTMEGHRLRVGSLAWSSSMLSSGSRDKS